ncbi:MAG TPA: hypothetical protein VGV60_00965 [Candidatus Polarisedimenticolia bacterium]|jgi:hypothetical protein|nr:hypothetical protein [Candidatus Polarisedimenticolia bacterium]
MSRAPEDRLPAEGLPGLCRHLRTKRYYYGSTDEVLEVAELSTTAQFWCLRTMRVVGPDEGYVTVVSCRAGRSCCEPPEA